jgi:pimeloyl-ACP methyl ester carboxylesterase
VRLACRDFGGDGSPVLLLHGLAGHAEEWADTARWLAEDHRVLALDARGHGRSARAPRDVSPEAHVADTAFVIERLTLGPVVLVGQSLGGHTAMLVAARWPELVSGLVVAESSPAGGEGIDEAVQSLGESLRRWPAPFATREAALEFFTGRYGGSLAAEAWADGLEQRDGGWWPRFDVEVMERTLQQALGRSYWEEWDRVRCHTLVVRAGRGHVDPALAHEMSRRLGHAQIVVLEGADHDLHLDHPREWREALSGFLTSLPVAPGRP